MGIVVIAVILVPALVVGHISIKNHTKRNKKRIDGCCECMECEKIYFEMQSTAGNKIRFCSSACETFFAQ